MTVHRPHRVRVGAVQHDQLGIARPIAECALIHLGGQARASHAHQNHVTGAVGPHTVRESAQVVEQVVHRFGQRKPTQPIGDLGLRLGRPKGVVLGPEPANKRCVRPGVDAGIDEFGVLAEPEDLRIGVARAQPPPLLVQSVKQLMKGLGERGDTLRL